jgi:hypothetical protein
VAVAGNTLLDRRVDGNRRDLTPGPRREKFFRRRPNDVKKSCYSFDLSQRTAAGAAHYPIVGIAAGQFLSLPLLLCRHNN